MATNRFRYNLSAPVLLIDESPQALCERKPPFGLHADGRTLSG
eukprot:CAMPEP_0119358272 /NCGR_PEP_ID=MMETSP1334-20130426/6515_1 /TAXON_ID=127549 /ORGANISM="Calcidiscus leptoporus, Strain RCC1130" /LENGTH=42 /DNA_ID= /DNA_START= /DNA_END= /DNA_ORIENTATION=